MDRLVWMSLAEARSRFHYRRDSYAIDALEALADSAMATSAVLLVCNAHAVPDGRWDGAEGDRPLDVEGQEQADALRRTLSAFGPSRLLSAGEARFLHTMRPLGAELGLPVETKPAFGEEEYAARPPQSRAVTRREPGTGRQ